jgi:hypothetical protein
LAQLLATLNKGIGESRRRSLEELKHLTRDASTITDPELLQTNLERARSIANQHLGDEEFQTLTLSIEQRQTNLTATFSAPTMAVAPAATGTPATSGPADQPTLEIPQASPVAVQATANLASIEEERASGVFFDQTTGSRPQRPDMSGGIEGSTSAPRSATPGQSSEDDVSRTAAGTASVATRRMLAWIATAAGILILTSAGLFFWKRSATQTVPAATSITLEIRTNPPGAKVLVDGEPKGSSNLSLALQAGGHQIRAELEGYEPGVASANLSEGTSTSPLEINLKPLAAAAEPDATKPDTAVPATTEPQTAATPSSAKRRPEPVVVVAKAVAPREEIALKPTLGVLVLKRSPSGAQVSIQGPADMAPRPITEDHLELLEGPYVLTVTAPGYTKATVPASIEAGKTREIALELQPVKASPADWKAVWERPDGWNIEGDWLVRRGGNFVLSNFPAKAGSYAFTLWRKGKSAQWVVNYHDEKNYCLFEIDSKSLSRTVVRNGKKGLNIKVPHSLEKQTTYTLQVSVAGNTITHKIFDGKSWVMLDELKFPRADSTVGKFGMFVPGKDQVGLSHLTFKPI